MSTWIKPLRPWLKFAGIVLAVAVLYMARAILVPVAFALLLTFTLAPLAKFVQRFIGRTASVIAVVLVVFSVLGALAWTFTGQLASLATEMPAYRQNIRDKINDIRLMSHGGSLEKVQEAVKDIQEEISRPEEAAATPENAPIPVVEAKPDENILGLPMDLGGLLDALAGAGLIVVFVVFMLLERGELRDRLIRLLGAGRLTVATRALDEAGERITRYLSRHAIVNGTFGVGVGLGLYLLGVPYAVLWGCLAAVLRFVPYVGPWLSAIAPFLLSLAVFPGWTRPLVVAGLFLVAELFTNLVMETLLYAGAAGVSKVGLIVAIAFWTWLWGPLGLLMATPLTVCLVVVGKYVPSMSFLSTLLGDQPVLRPEAAFYQRLVAGDRDDAAEIFENSLAHTEVAETTFDELVIPALCYARRDLDAGYLSTDEEREITANVARIVDDVYTEHRRAAARERSEAAPSATRVAVLGCPAAGEADALALRCFQYLLDPALVELEIVPPNVLSSEMVDLVSERAATTVYIVALPPRELNHARYLCKRLRAAHPRLRILVGRWGPVGLGGHGAETLLAAGADAVAATLLESRTHLLGVPVGADQPALPRRVSGVA